MTASSHIKRSLAFLTSAFVFLFISLSTKAQEKNNVLKLWYANPANTWEDAMPIGNGRAGAMIFGQPALEHFQLNEDEFWAGSPYNNSNPMGTESLDDVRKLISSGRFKEADELMRTDFVAETVHGMPYQTVGDLHLNFPQHENFSNYYRELDINRAVSLTRYTVNGITYTRESFASMTDGVIIVRISADKPGSVSFSASFSTDQKKTFHPFYRQPIEFISNRSRPPGYTWYDKSSGQYPYQQSGWHSFKKRYQFVGK